MEDSNPQGFRSRPIAGVDELVRRNLREGT
jgi:hypothetical protein